MVIIGVIAGLFQDAILPIFGSKTDSIELKELVYQLSKDDFTRAISLFNSGDLNAKKGVIIELKNKAIRDISSRQKISSFLSSLNDWITEDARFNEIIMNPEMQWTKWKKEKLLLEYQGRIFEKEKQILSIEASKAIDEIIFEHIKYPTKFKLSFHNKNLLGLLFAGYDFRNNNLNLDSANLYGAYFWGSKHLKLTNFIYAKYYGNTLFRDLDLPNKIFVNHELGTKYYGNVSFLNVRFSFGLNLTNATFNQEAHFVSCEFIRDALFMVSNFHKEASFIGCSFWKKVQFNGATFRDKTSFERTKFFEEVEFSSVDFQKNCNFKGASFLSKPKFNGTNIDMLINLNLF